MKGVAGAGEGKGRIVLVFLEHQRIVVSSIPDFYEEANYFSWLLSNLRSNNEISCCHLFVTYIFMSCSVA